MRCLHIFLFLNLLFINRILPDLVFKVQVQGNRYKENDKKYSLESNVEKKYIITISKKTIEDAFKNSDKIKVRSLVNLLKEKIHFDLSKKSCIIKIDNKYYLSSCKICKSKILKNKSSINVYFRDTFKFIVCRPNKKKDYYTVCDNKCSYDDFEGNLIKLDKLLRDAPYLNLSEIKYIISKYNIFKDFAIILLQDVDFKSKTGRINAYFTLETAKCVRLNVYLKNDEGKIIKSAELGRYSVSSIFNLFDMMDAFSCFFGIVDIKEIHYIDKNGQTNVFLAPGGNDGIKNVDKKIIGKMLKKIEIDDNQIMNVELKTLYTYNVYDKSDGKKYNVYSAKKLKRVDLIDMFLSSQRGEYNKRGLSYYSTCNNDDILNDNYTLIINPKKSSCVCSLK